MPADRATSPVVGVVAMLAVTVLLAASVGVAIQGAPAGPPPAAHFELSASPGTVALVHAGGDRLDVRDLRVQIEVDGRPLAHQPPVPFFAARGFRAGPTGPFNVAADPAWTAGERASVSVASTNAPAITGGSRVTVSLYRDGTLLWRGSTKVGRR